MFKLGGPQNARRYYVFKMIGLLALLVTVGVLFLVEKPGRDGMIGGLLIVGVFLAGIVYNAFRFRKSKPDDTL